MKKFDFSFLTCNPWCKSSKISTETNRHLDTINIEKLDRPHHLLGCLHSNYLCITFENTFTRIPLLCLKKNS